MQMSEASSPDSRQASSRDYLVWYIRGFRVVLTVPALILATSFIGFAAMAMEARLTVLEAVFMTAAVWALPGMVVLVGAIIAGNSLPAAAFAVALSSVRLAPMVMALLPELRTRSTRKWVLYLLSHFVAVTSWVIAMERARKVPRGMRTAWYGGVGSVLVLTNMAVVAVVYVLARDLPPLASAALLMLTPLYFLTSLWGSARERAGHVAMVLGLLLGPLFAILTPEFSLLATGAVGGGLAYLYHVLTRSRERA